MAERTVKFWQEIKDCVIQQHGACKEEKEERIKFLETGNHIQKSDDLIKYGIQCTLGVHWEKSCNSFGQNFNSFKDCQIRIHKKLYLLCHFFAISPYSMPLWRSIQVFFTVRK